MSRFKNTQTSTVAGYTPPQSGLVSALILAVAMGAASQAQAADIGPTSAFLSGPDSFTLDTFLNKDTNPFTYMGVTAYATVDVGWSSQSHGSGYNADFPTTVGDIVQKNDFKSTSYLTGSSMEQSKMGLKGNEAVTDDVSVVFKLESAFNPINGNLPNAQKSFVDNYNYKYTYGSSTMGDSSRAGQPFNGGAYIGLSNPTFGTLTFGRHQTPLFEAVQSYDPQNYSYAFSPLGFSAKFASSGGNDTEDARLDRSLKYNVKYGPVRFAALYQLPFNTSSVGGDYAIQTVLGADYGDISVDTFWTYKKMAVNFGNPDTTTTNSGYYYDYLSAAISDNIAFGAMAKYDLKPVKMMIGYEHMTMMNPGTTPTGSTLGSSIGGFNIFLQSTDANVSEGIGASTSKAGAYTQFATAQMYDTFWLGARYAIMDDLTAAFAYYLWHQENGSGVDNGVCLFFNAANKNSAAYRAGTNNTNCAGNETFVSSSLDYQINKRFDVYAGVMYSRVDDGLYVGQSYQHNNNVNTATGIRFKF